MPRHIGIVACSAEGAALCYRTLCVEAPALMGRHMHPEISMHTYPLGSYMDAIYENDWQRVGSLMLASVEKLARIGAEFAICPDNTIHQAFEHVVNKSPIDWLHIAQAVAEEACLKGYKKLGITGTRYLMTGPVYPGRLESCGLQWAVPGQQDRSMIDRIIFDELVNGVFREQSRAYFNEVFQKLKDRGCDAVVLGCTEIPLLVDPGDCPLPVLDSTRLLARAALKRALSETSMA